MTIHDKYRVLQENLKALGSVAVAFSSGVDSTFLLKAAQEALGDKVIAVTASSCSFPKRELEEAKAFCEKNGICQIIVESEELDIDGFRQNPKNRCYLCKKSLFEKLLAYADEAGAETILEGTNEDDLNVYRPGLVAVRELGVKSPLAEAHLTKPEVRALAKKEGISVANRPAAPCLATRLPYGSELDFEVLKKIDEGEQYMKSLGFEIVRIRLHGNVTRIEVPVAEFGKFMEQREAVLAKLKELGFVYVTLDMEGFRSGSMDVDVDK